MCKTASRTATRQAATAASQPLTARAAFTLVELLVVVGVVAVLIAIILPVLFVSREKARRLQCASNLRTFGQVTMQYAADNDGILPQHPGQSNWLWDMPHGTRDAFAHLGKMPREMFYCPSGERVIEGLWTFDPTFAVTGYFWLGNRPGVRSGATLVQTNLERDRPFQYPDEDRWIKSLRNKTVKNAPGSLVLMADGIVSRDMTRAHANKNFVTVFGGYAEAHGSSHLDAHDRPQGGNTLYMDGRVELRPFDFYKLRSRGPSPYFWF